jgi:hypothetical protein
MVGECGIHTAKTLFQLRGEFSAFWVAHNRWRHGRRPRDVIALQRLKQALDVRRLEASVIVSVIDV